MALLDVQVMKIFPIGFVQTDQAGRSSRPCDQSGEDEAQRAWEVRRILANISKWTDNFDPILQERRMNEASKWRVHFEKQLERMKVAVDKLRYTARGTNTNPDGAYFIFLFRSQTLTCKFFSITTQRNRELPGRA